MEEQKTECPFCKINKEKTRILEESEHSTVVLSNPRLMEGHCLVIPKRHIEKISELEETELNDLMNLVTKFQERILSNLSKGCDIRQNYRPFQKQDRLKVNHLHIHLQPRELFDELYERSQITEKEIFKDLTGSEIKRVSGLLDKQKP
jgi:histidine triad (HIT) family protein